jgi:protein FRA10AC1
MCVDPEIEWCGAWLQYSRHVHFINTYVLNYVGSGAGGLAGAEAQEQQAAGYKTDRDIVRAEHRFLWDAQDTEEGATWEKRLAKRYYDKLFKEYAIADLSRYRENKIALRWRTQHEVVSGKGQFVCGARKCSERAGLKSWEVNFGYVEHGEKRNALVKVRLCAPCSAKLNYRTQRRKAKARKEADAEARAESKGRGNTRGNDGDVEARAADTASASGSGADASSVWGAARADKDEEELQAEDFDKYFDDMFL